ncbi:MAG: type II toxin-antitoxin system VapC family toxin [Acidobacteria bacterium]|nr:type II toxin-antitoxin system VapC family toxin [Acidobacteriota bacterium]
MRYMLDTDICSYVIRARDPKLLAIMQEMADSGDELVISAVTYAELRSGAERSLSAGRYNHAIRLFCDRLNSVLAWDMAAADEFATLQGKLFRVGKPIGRNDTMIAAHALTLGCVLVTNNQKHFSRVPGLETENWIE